MCFNLNCYNKYFSVVLCICSLLFTANTSIAQSPPINWQNVIGGNGEDQIKVIASTADHGYLLGCLSTSNNSIDKSENSFGGRDYWVVKLNSEGNIEWENTIGGSGDDYLNAAIVTSDGGYLIGGESYSPISGEKTSPKYGLSDYWVVKLDAAGNVMWQRTFGGNSYDVCNALAETASGDYLIGGASGSGISGNKTAISYGGYDYWVLKINVMGAVVNQLSLGGDMSDIMTDIEITDDGGYAAVGYSESNLTGNRTSFSRGGADIWLVKIDNADNIEFDQAYGTSTWDYTYSMAANETGYIIGGTTSGGISGDKTEPSNGSSDYWVIQTNIDGAIVWQNNIGGNAEDQLRGIDITPSGNIFLAGYSSSGIGFDKTVPIDGLADYWLMELNSLGSIIWQENLGGEFADYAYALNSKTEGKYVIGGISTPGLSGDKSEAGFSGYDVWLIQLEENCQATDEICNSVDDNCNGLIDDGIIETISITASGSTTFCQGSSVLLTATYSGASVQWKKNGTNIPGATIATYNVTTKGNYSCVTTSACDTTESTPIFVNVIKNPNASISAGGPTTFCAGGSVVLTEVAVAGCTYQWYKGATPIAGATALTYTATSSGNYKCRVTKAATGCYKNSNAIVVSVPCKEGLPTGDEMIAKEINVYPNPATTIITIQTNNNNVKEIFIYDAIGNVIMKQIASEMSTDMVIDYLPAGIYFIQVLDGEYSNMNNFVKQ